MRLVVFSHKLFRQTREGLQTNGAFTIQMDALAEHCDKLVLCVPIQQDLEFKGVSITAPNIHFHPLPYFGGRMSFLRTIPALRREILSAVKKTDLGLVILPGYFGALASWLCKKQQFPIFQWVVGNWSLNVQSRRKHSIKGGLAALWSPGLDWLMQRLTRDVLTFFNGRILYTPPQPHHHTRVSSSILLQDVYERPATVVTPPYNLLFVGRLSAEKGVIYLIQAISLLQDNGHDVILHLVGEGAEQTKLMQEVQAHSLTEQVIFHGFVPFGKSLRQLYRQSDLFILPALQDQQPKVLMEAMSQGVPVIATRTGGIPGIVKDGENGLLVSPGQPEALAGAIMNILTNAHLYQKVVQQGFRFVEQHTVDAETVKMMQIVKTNFGFG